MDITEAALRATVILAMALIGSSLVIWYIWFAVERDWSNITIGSTLIIGLWLMLLMMFWLRA